eukprot:4935140-Amphidinium_carterae.4
MELRDQAPLLLVLLVPASERRGKLKIAEAEAAARESLKVCEGLCKIRADAGRGFIQVLANGTLRTGRSGRQGFLGR